MKKLLFILLLPLLATAQVGWQQLGNNANPSTTTALLSFAAGGQCPNSGAFPGVEGSTHCPAGVYSFSGGTYDRTGCRYILYGGGHADWGGNDVYEIPLCSGNPLIRRIVNFSQPGYANSSTLPFNEAMPDGTQNVRHTWGGIIQVPPTTRTNSKSLLFTFGGTPAGPGGFTDAVWELDLSALTVGVANQTPSWTARYNPGTSNAKFNSDGTAAAYDSVTDTVIVITGHQPYLGASDSPIYQWQYNAGTSTYTLKKLIELSFTSDGSGFPALSENITIDTRRRIMFGIKNTLNEFVYVDISGLTTAGTETLCPGGGTTCSNPSTVTWSTVDASCAAALSTYNGSAGSLVVSPSLSYDPLFGVIIIYPAHGNTVYLFNPGDPFHPSSATDTTLYIPTYAPTGLAPRHCAAVNYGSTQGTDFPDDSGHTMGNEYGAVQRFTYAPNVDMLFYTPAPAVPAWGLRMARPLGMGATTYNCIDKDADGYGVGPGCLGPDADDNDPEVNTTASVVAKYGSVLAFITHATAQHAAYAPGGYVFVSPSGNDSTCVRSTTFATALASPCLTYPKAASLVQASDALIARSGTYTFVTSPTSITVSGASSSAPTIYMSYPGELGVLDFTGVGGGLGIVNKSNITIDGLKFQNLTNNNDGCISGGSFYADQTVTGPSLFQNNTVRNVETTNCFWGVDAFDGLVNFLIEDSSMHDEPVAGEHNIYIGSRTIPSSNVTVRRNLLYKAQFTGMQFNGRVTGLTIDSNIIHSNLLGCVSLEMGPTGSTVTNNLCFNNGQDGIVLFDYPGACTSGIYGICPYDVTNNVIENNSIWIGNTKPDGTAMDQQPCFAMNDTSGSVHSFDGNIFRNNICVNQNGWMFDMYASLDANVIPTTTASNNVYYSTVRSSDLNIMRTGLGGASPGFLTFANLNSSYPTQGWGTNQLADPLYYAVNTSWWNSPQNFSLDIKNGSAAIDSGTSTGAPSLDLRGIARSPAVTAGVYQGGVTSVTPGPATFTLTVVLLGSGGGTVTSNVGGINCGSACASTYTTNSSVTLTASAAAGSTFAGWGGACAGTTTTCTLSVTSNLTATATFNLNVTPPPSSSGFKVRNPKLKGSIKAH